MLRNPVTGKDEVVSQDTVELRVVALKSVQIRTPLVRIRSGAIMPATLWGLPDISPMVLGTLQNTQIFWTVSHPEVVEIFNVFTAAGKLIFNTSSQSAQIRHKSVEKLALRPPSAQISNPKCSSMSLLG